MVDMFFIYRSANRALSGFGFGSASLVNTLVPLRHSLADVSILLC
jgi:hypothetical protein